MKVNVFEVKSIYTCTHTCITVVIKTSDDLGESEESPVRVRKVLVAVLLQDVFMAINSQGCCHLKNKPKMNPPKLGR